MSARYIQKGRKRPDNGKRVLIWVPTRDLWVIEAVDDIVNAVELSGVPTSRSREIILLLKQGVETSHGKNESKM